MSDFFEDVLSPILVLIGMILGLILLSILCVDANAHWNCSTWAKNTGDQTKVMAATCYVKNGAHWELFDTYVATHHIDIQEPAK